MDKPEVIHNSYSLLDKVANILELRSILDSKLHYSFSSHTIGCSTINSIEDYIQQLVVSDNLQDTEVWLLVILDKVLDLGNLVKLLAPICKIYKNFMRQFTFIAAIRMLIVT